MMNLRNSRFRYVGRSISLTFMRFKNHDQHWSVLKKKETIADKALTHLDDFYGSTFGERWNNIKKAITKPNKYVAVVNNFSDDLDTIDHLEKIGCLNLKDVYEERKDILKYKGNANILKNEESDVDKKIEKIARQLSEEELSELYGDNEDVSPPQTLDTGGTFIEQIDHQINDSKPLNDELSISNYEESRIILPTSGGTSMALWNYVPATKLKGMEDWLPESHQFQQYLGAKDFPVHIEEVDKFEIPHFLNIYAFPIKSKLKFHEPKTGTAGVTNYYLMDGASIFPVIALNPRSGDRVLDMCASPGGKTLLLLQTMMPGLVIANDLQLSRINRIHKVLSEYLYDYKTSDVWHDRVIVTQSDGRRIEDDIGFDKILVDAPCTSDRHSVRDSENNIFKTSRIKERLRLPEVQCNLLCNALKLCKVGGTVVYSTCTLSPLQNDGVVIAALKKVHKMHGIEATVKLFPNGILPYCGMFHFGEGSLIAKYGHVIVPHTDSNFGPSYFATIVRTA